MGESIDFFAINIISPPTFRQAVYPCLSPNDIPVVPTTVATV